MPPTITFLSDYGQADDFVGTCHGVMARICPEARVLDLPRGIDRHDARRGALVLRNTLPYFPAGVHLAVVDPEVGRGRRAGALRTAGGGRPPGGGAARGGGAPRARGPQQRAAATRAGALGGGGRGGRHRPLAVAA